MATVPDHVMDSFGDIAYRLLAEAVRERDAAIADAGRQREVVLAVCEKLYTVSRHLTVLSERKEVRRVK